MEASSPRQKIGGKSLSDLLSTRSGAIAVAAGAAILAGVLLFAFVQRYKNNSATTNAPTAVFVARAMIPQGTSAELIASQELIQRTTVKSSQVQVGAIADSAAVRGLVALHNIYPGQQLTLSDFTANATIASDLSGPQRAIAIPVDSAHGLNGFVRAGDHVDVLATTASGGGNQTVSTLLQDVYVLSTPLASAGGGLGGGGGGGSSNIVLRIPTQYAGKFAFAADNGKVWIILRPPAPATQASQPGSAGASQTPSTAATTGAP